MNLAILFLEGLGQKLSKSWQPLPVGTKVVKKSGKPFKSGLKQATVKGVVEHPHLIGIDAYIFEEDDSYVRCDTCWAV